jgi:transcriptional regulator with GAF, ATPase, and Fis domain
LDVTIPNDASNHIASEALRMLGEHFGVDCVTIGTISKGGVIQTPTWFWSSNKISQGDLRRAIEVSPIPQSITRLNGEGALVFESLAEFQNVLLNQGTLNQSRIESGAIIVLRDAGDDLECLSLFSIHRKIVWPVDIVEQLGITGEIIINALRNMDKESQLLELRRFEQLVAEIAADFVGQPPELVDNKIESALGQVCKCLQLDLGTLMQWSDSDRSYLEVTHEWGSPATEGPHFKGFQVGKEFRYLFDRLRSGDSYLVNQIDEFGQGAELERQTCEKIGIKSVLWVPFGQKDEVEGFVALNSLNESRTWSEDIVQHLRLIGEVFAHALTHRYADLELKNAYEEISKLKSKLEIENKELRAELSHQPNNSELIGNSLTVQRLVQQIKQVAPTDSTVLLQGETGTGKNVVAGTIHNLSQRKKQALITVDCTALPAPLIESELFGHEKGAFTGAVSRKLGRFELANKGTLFLDEIGELPLELQAKLLRVLQDGEFERVGSSATQIVDVRVIAATNRDLELLVSQGKFRADLFYRLSVFPVNIPPLRDRPDDIPLLVWFFAQKLRGRVGKRFDTLSQEDINRLMEYDWPGNVRELSNLVERAMILSSGPTLEFGNILPKPNLSAGIVTPSIPYSGSRLEDIERDHIKQVLEECNWRVRGDDGAAERLGLKRSTLQSRMKKLGIERPENRR